MVYGFNYAASNNKNKSRKVWSPSPNHCHPPEGKQYYTVVNSWGNSVGLKLYASGKTSLAPGII